MYKQIDKEVVFKPFKGIEDYAITREFILKDIPKDKLFEVIMLEQKIISTFMLQPEIAKDIF